MAVERIDPLDYDGEPLVLEHYARYVFAGQFAVGQRVLDVACGTGYGSSLLHGLGANEVVGVDVAPEAIQVANSRYADDAVTFIAGDAHHVSDVVNGPFGLITSFETLEHLVHPERLLAECVKLGSQDLVLVVSVPNEPHLSGENPFHVQGFDREHFADMLRQHFSTVTVLPQYFAVASAIETANSSSYAGLRRTEGTLCFTDNGHMQADSFVAVCTNASAGPRSMAAQRPSTVHGRRFWEYHRQSETARSWLEQQRVLWQQTAEDYEKQVLAEHAQIRQLEQVVSELTQARDWLKQERAKWQGVAEQHLALVNERDEQIRSLEEAKLWLEEQRSAWQHAAEAAAGAASDDE